MLSKSSILLHLSSSKIISSQLTKCHKLKTIVSAPPIYQSRNFSLSFNRYSNVDSETDTKIMCKQLIMEEYGEPHKVVKMKCSSLPELQRGEILIKFLASTINPADINTIQGMYAIKPTLPCILGNEGVGKVIAVHPEDKNSSLNIGDLVIPSKNAWGTWRTHAIATETDILKIPSNLDPISGAVLAVNPSTAYRMLTDFVTLKAGNSVIQNAANSSVGRFVIQLCKHYGYKSINVVRNRPEISELKEELENLGADVVVTEEEIRTKGVLKDYPKPSLALNCVSGRSGAELLRHVQDAGVMVTYGGMARQPVTVPVGSLIFNDVKVVGYWQTRWNNDPKNKEKRRLMLDELSKLFIEKKLVPPPHSEVKFDDYLKALEDTMPSQGQIGAKQIIIFE